MVDVEAVGQFLRSEMRALNDERYEDWLDLLTADFEYRLPAPILRDDPSQPRYGAQNLLAWESKPSLKFRFDRLQYEFAWADRPAAFHRRHLTDFRVEPRNGDELATQGGLEVVVKSDVLVARSRHPEGTEILSAGREDVLRIEGGELRLANRTVYVDTDRPVLSQIVALF